MACVGAGGGLAGGVYAWYVSVFYPDNVFSGDFSIFAIVFALFGGVATICGPIVGVIILYGIYNLIGFTTPQYFQLIYGLLIMGLVLFLPAGPGFARDAQGLACPLTARPFSTSPSSSNASAAFTRSTA